MTEGGITMALETIMSRSSRHITLGASLLSAALVFSGCDGRNDTPEQGSEKDGGATVVPAYHCGSTIIYSRPGMTFVPDTPANYYHGSAGKSGGSSVKGASTTARGGFGGSYHGASS